LLDQILARVVLEHAEVRCVGELEPPLLCNVVACIRSVWTNVGSMRGSGDRCASGERSSGGGAGA
jgi:hypothetical protein